jgi:hypothetical protein
VVVHSFFSVWTEVGVCHYALRRCLRCALRVMDSVTRALITQVLMKGSGMDHHWRTLEGRGVEKVFHALAMFWREICSGGR